MCQKSSLDDNPYKHPESINFLETELILRKFHNDIFLIHLLGGEPLYYEEFNKVICLLNELKIAYCITSNGALFDAKKIEMVVGNCAWISLSLDAANPKLYTFIRRGGSINKVAENLKNISKEKDKRKTKLPLLNASATLFDYNIGDVNNLLEFCKINSIKSLSLSGGHLYNTKLVTENNLLRNHKKMALDYIESAKATAHHLGILLRVALRSLYQVKRDKTVRPNKKFDIYFEITIQPNFDVVAAGKKYAKMGNLSETDISKIWNGKTSEYRKFRSDCIN